MKWFVGLAYQIFRCLFAAKTTQENASSMVSISGRFNDRSPCPVGFDIACNSSLVDVMGIDSFNEFQFLFIFSWNLIEIYGNMAILQHPHGLSRLLPNPPQDFKPSSKTKQLTQTIENAPFRIKVWFQQNTCPNPPKYPRILPATCAAACINSVASRTTGEVAWPESTGTLHDIAAALHTSWITWLCHYVDSVDYVDWM